MSIKYFINEQISKFSSEDFSCHINFDSTDDILIPVAYICNKSSSKRVQNENRNIHTIYKEGQDIFFSICRSVSVLLSW